MHRQKKGISGQSSSAQPSALLSVRAVNGQSQPSTSQVEGDDSSSSSYSGRKRRRGPTRGLNLLTMPPGERLAVVFNQDGQPIGETSSEFSNLCGVIVRNPYFAPLQVEKWAEIPKHSKEMMWRHIQEHADVGDERRKWVIQSLGKKFKDYRKKLKENYSKWKTDKERLGHLPPNISNADWTWLVQYWSSPKAVTERNKANRNHQKIRHTGGTKSFARHKNEETQSGTDGSTPPRANLFIRTHSQKDGKVVDDSSREIISKFRELSAMSPQDGSSSFVGDGIYAQVMGPERHGRVCGYGLGLMPTPAFDSPSSQYRAHYEEMHAQLDDMRQQMEGLKTKHSEEMQMLREEMQRHREEMQRKWEEMKRKHDEMMEVVRRMMSDQC